MTGAELIAAERQRQIEQEGWTPEHDDKHATGALKKAAYAYLAYGECPRYPTGSPPACWPWSAEWWKPSYDPARNLVKVGALIAAEIDRLKRCGSDGDEDYEEDEPSVTFTAGYLLDRRMWGAACDLLGLNEFAIAEGRMDLTDYVSMSMSQAKKIGAI